jgi:hypothetical protein
MNVALIDYDDLKAVLSLDENSEAAYPQLEYLMTVTESAIESFCSRSFSYSTNITDTIQVGSPTRIITLDRPPIVSLSSVTVDGESVSSDSYRLFGDWGLKWSYAINDVDVVVTYVGGYKKTTAPADLKKALVIQVAYEYQNIDNIGASSVRTEGGTIERPPLQLLPEVQRLLGKYRHPARGRW